MKIKIRKVEATPIEFFNALSTLVSIHEKIPRDTYQGTNLEYVCRNLGVKTLEFWRFKFENEEYFDNHFVIQKIGSTPNIFNIWRKETFDNFTDNQQS